MECALVAIRSSPWLRRLRGWLEVKSETGRAIIGTSRKHLMTICVTLKREWQSEVLAMKGQ
ncbi:MAG: hypothetical protein ACUVWA_08725 [Candidatus Oleimicrobiaceae bacterium]